MREPMAETRKTDETATNPRVIRRQQVSTWLAVAGALGIGLGALAWYPRCVDEAMDDRRPDRRIRVGVEPNQAAWFELAQLPGIGPSLARRIVDFREVERARVSDGRPIFARPADLRRVKGLGQKKVARVGRLLWFEASADGIDN